MKNNIFKEGDLVKVNNDWWDAKAANRLWIVGDPDWFDKCYLIAINSRNRYLQNSDLNSWANDWRVKKTQVPPKYLTKVNWDELNLNKENYRGRSIAGKMIFLLIILAIVLIGFYIKIMFRF